MRRDLALALLAREELLVAVDEAVRSLEPAEQESVVRVRRELVARAEQARSEIEVDTGLPVSNVARRFGLAEPTIRGWLASGLLTRVPERSPVEVSINSIVRAERIFERVRESYPAREWTSQLAAYLHDQDLAEQRWAGEGRTARDHGDIVEI